MLKKGIRKGALVFLATVLIGVGSMSVYASDQGTQTETPIPTEAPVPTGTPELPPRTATRKTTGNKERIKERGQILPVLRQRKTGEKQVENY